MHHRVVDTDTTTGRVSDNQFHVARLFAEDIQCQGLVSVPRDSPSSLNKGEEKINPSIHQERERRRFNQEEEENIQKRVLNCTKYQRGMKSLTKKE